MLRKNRADARWAVVALGALVPISQTLAQCSPGDPPLPPPPGGPIALLYSLNGQTTEAEPDGSFIISNVAVPDVQAPFNVGVLNQWIPSAAFRDFLGRMSLSLLTIQRLRLRRGVRAVLRRSSSSAYNVRSRRSRTSANDLICLFMRVPMRFRDNRGSIAVLGIFMGAMFPLYMYLIELPVELWVPRSFMPGGSTLFILFCTPFVYGATILCAPRIFRRWLQSGEDAWVWGLAMGVGFCVAIGVFFYFTGVFKSWPPRGEKHEVFYWVPPILLVHAVAGRLAWMLFGTRRQV